MQTKTLTPPASATAIQHHGAPWNSIAQTVDRLVNGISNGFEMSPLRPAARTGDAPSLDILESVEDLRVEIELPGLTEADVEVSIADDVLTVSGQKVSTGLEGYAYRHSERYYGAFQRRFALPCPVDQDRVTAALEAGVLVVTLPKAEEARPRKVAISSKS